MMKKFLMYFATIVIAFVILPGCMQQAVDVKSEIEEANIAFMEAVNNGDAEALTDIYLPDAVVYPPNADKINGSDKIIPMMAGTAASGVKVMFETVSAMAYGSIAIEEGQYKILAGEIVADHGKYIVTWKKKGDKWMVSQDIYNTSMPAAPKAMAGDSVLFALTKMKEEDAHLIEEFTLELFKPVYEELYPEDKAVTRIFKTTSPDKDGYITFVYLADPFSSEQVHNVFTVMRAKYGKEKTQELMKKYMGIFKNQTGYFTTQMDY